VSNRYIQKTHTEDILGCYHPQQERHHRVWAGRSQVYSRISPLAMIVILRTWCEGLGVQDSSRHHCPFTFLYILVNAFLDVGPTYSCRTSLALHNLSLDCSVPKGSFDSVKLGLGVISNSVAMCGRIMTRRETPLPESFLIVLSCLDRWVRPPLS
jgi:hypothetical protein